MKRILTAALGAVCGVVLAISCSSFATKAVREIAIPLEAPTPAVKKDTAPARNTAYVTIRNENWSYMRVYLMENGNTPRPLTRTETNTIVTVPFRVTDGSHYSFVLAPLAGSENYTTNAIPVMSGDTLMLYIANHLNFTALARVSR